MKTLSLILSILIVFSTLIYSAEIHFISPTNGSILTETGYGSSATTVPVNLLFNYTGTGNPNMVKNGIKLYTHQYVYDTRNNEAIPQWFYLAPGSYTWKLELFEFYIGGSGFAKVAEQTITFEVKHKMWIYNNYGGGNLNVDGQQPGSGVEVKKFISENLAVGAIDKDMGPYKWVWNTTSINRSNWLIKKMTSSQTNISGAAARDYNYSVQSDDNGAKITADMKKAHKLTFVNQFSGTTQTGTMSINGNTVAAPAASYVVEQNSVTVTANYEYHDFDTYFTYRFSNWSDGVTTETRTISSPTGAQNYTAIYKKVPKFTFSISNLQITAAANNHVKLTWTEHPDPGVSSYQIWRRIRYKNGVMQSYTPIYYATVNRGVGQFIDPNLSFTQDENEDRYLISYCVVACYYPDQTTSPVTIWTSDIETWQDGSTGNPIGKQSASSVASITEYSIQNYPNPFNPTTQIDYALKEDGFVTLKIYDITGREVATLVNERLSKGKYTAEFNASNLSSGVYLCTIRVNDYFATKKMILTK